MKEVPRNLLDETLTGCLARHFKTASDKQRGLSFESHSDHALELFDARTPANYRSGKMAVKFSRDTDGDNRRHLNAQQLRRWFGVGRSNLAPLDVLEVFVLAMPDEFRASLLQDMAARLNAIYVPKPNPADGQDVVKFSAAVTAFGEMCRELGPIFADNLVNAKDAPLVPVALQRIRQLITAAFALEAQLLAVLTTAYVENCADNGAQS